MNKFKMPARNKLSNKGTFGKVLNVSGCKNYIGAPYLSTLGILKIGAGLAALASYDNIIAAVSSMLPEAVYYSHTQAYKNINKFNILLMGCGLGQTSFSKKIFNRFIKAAYDLNIPSVIDADGLNILSSTKNNILKMPQKLIITPHPMEASRLLQMDLDVILSDLHGAAKMLSDKYNCVVVLKSYNTVICQKDKIYLFEQANSALAKGGTGDVLAGIIAGLLAQGMEPFEASKLGVYLHSRSGKIASDNLTEYSVLASDLLKYLPDAIAEIL